MSSYVYRAEEWYGYDGDKRIRLCQIRRMIDPALIRSDLQRSENLGLTSVQVGIREVYEAVHTTADKDKLPVTQHKRNGAR